MLTSCLRQRSYEHPLHTDLWADTDVVRDEVEDGMPPVDFLQQWFNGLHPHHQDEDDEDYYTDDDEEEGSEIWDEESEGEEEESEGEGEEEGMEGGEGGAPQGGGDVEPMAPAQHEE